MFFPALWCECPLSTWMSLLTEYAKALVVVQGPLHALVWAWVVYEQSRINITVHEFVVFRASAVLTDILSYRSHLNVLGTLCDLFSLEIDSWLLCSSLNNPQLLLDVVLRRVGGLAPAHKFFKCTSLPSLSCSLRHLCSRAAARPLQRQCDVWDSVWLDAAPYTQEHDIG